MDSWFCWKSRESRAALDAGQTISQPAAFVMRSLRATGWRWVDVVSDAERNKTARSEYFYRIAFAIAGAGSQAGRAAWRLVEV